LTQERAEPQREEAFEDIVGNSPQMRELFRELRLLAAVKAAVLLQGERGVGKELAARALHQLSPRAAGPFVPIDAGGLSPALFPGELLGHAEGAFSGALAAQEGLAVAADRGTLFVDGVDELSPENQGLLRRFLAGGEVVPVEGEGLRRVDVRVVCSARRGLADDAAGGVLDEALFGTLRLFALRVPPLRERAGDLPLLAEHFLRRGMLHYAKRLAGISPAAMELLAADRWEGNVRQLAEEIERAVVLTPAGGWVEPEVLSPRLLAGG
jgi:DNA-binding NtrC family response regulator